MYRVIIIDDEEIIREGIKKVIHWGSLQCSIVGDAADGDDGFEKIKLLNPDIIITDIRMPGLDGLDMIEKIKSFNIDAKIIILTGFRDFDYAQKALKLGAFRFILKPTKADELTECVKDAILELKKLKSERDFLSQMKLKLIEVYGVNDIEGAIEEKASDQENKVDLNNVSPNSTAFLSFQAINYLKENFKDDITLSSLASELYISSWYLSKILKKETGSNFIDILNYIRISEAKKLLKDRGLKVYEISEKCGYTDVSYFSKVFKKITNQTPLEYRNSMLTLDETDLSDV